MPERIVTVRTDDSSYIFFGEPLLDPSEGVLAIAFSDGTSRVFNWDKVIEFYHMTAEATEKFLEDYSRE
ncbi:hypothetical protein AU152_gp37 [Mycobacterium phage Phlei]|uniref:Uncharacterized protein n=1 Tax=Mycobacterium phage Phlei TaxID=1690684 RepID=A0A0N9BDQ8_9CAUD|nr:hypothetical protein AU152_gp37 [Mycobacterium phage Phlei]ALA48150.1 hypothetical protein [Mycobacterium phage Phlei]